MFVIAGRMYDETNILNDGSFGKAVRPKSLLLRYKEH